MLQDEPYSPFEQSPEAQEALARVRGAYEEGTLEVDEFEARIAQILRDDEIDWQVKQASDTGELDAMIEADIRRYTKPSADPSQALRK